MANPVAEATVGAGNYVLRADQLREPEQALGDQFGVLDDVGCVPHHAGHQRRAIRQSHVLPERPLVLVPWVGRLDRVAARWDLQDEVDDVP